MDDVDGRLPVVGDNLLHAPTLKPLYLDNFFFSGQTLGPGR